MQTGTEIVQEKWKGKEKGKEKRKIIIKKKQSEVEVDPSLSFRLIDFNIYDKNVDAQAPAQAPASYYQGNQNKKMVIQIFGINEVGETCALFVEDMNPFFYVLVPDTWNEYTKKKLCKRDDKAAALE